MSHTLARSLTVMPLLVFINACCCGQLNVVSVTVDLGTKDLRVGQCSRSVRGRRWQKGQEDPRGYGPGRVGPRGQRAPQGLEAAQAPPRPAAFLPQISPAPGRDRGNQRLEKTQWFILISTCDILI